MMRTTTLALSTGLTLAACAGQVTLDDFNCPVDQPGNCNTVSSADDIALKGSADGAAASTPRRFLPARAATADALRVGETTASVWIAPFVDREGNLHHGHEMRIVLEPGRWAVERAE